MAAQCFSGRPRRRDDPFPAVGEVDNAIILYRAIEKDRQRKGEGRGDAPWSPNGLGATRVLRTDDVNRLAGEIRIRIAANVSIPSLEASLPILPTVLSLFPGFPPLPAGFRENGSRGEGRGRSRT